jgi:nitrite reductase/ring-hydroxylating ferredoxin subunit
VLFRSIKPKLIVFLLIIILPLYLTSCKKSKNDVIPTVYVDFYISINDPQFFNLQAPFTYSYIDATTNNIGQAAAGYDGNGLIIFNSANEYYAYDRTCPHDYEVNKKSVKVTVDGILAICPECGTKYALTSNGTPYSGVGQYPLKNYRTYFNGLYIHVYNY